MNVRRIIDIARGRAEFIDKVRDHIDEIIISLALILNPEAPVSLNYESEEIEKSSRL